MARLVIGLAVLVIAAIPSPGWAKERTSTVTIVHGLPRFTADIYVDGELLLSGFEPKDATDPMELPAGDYEVAIRDAGAPEGSKPALAAELTVPGGKNLSVVAHLAEDGSPTVSVFDNDVSPIPPGKSRLLVRHQAEAPPIDVQADGQSLLSGVASGDQAGKALPAAAHDLSVVMAEGGESLTSPTTLDFEEGTAYFVYLIGSSVEETLDLMVQRVRGLHSGPSGVQTGYGGLSAEGGFPVWALILMWFALLGLATSSVVLRGRRRLPRS
jgi:Domain of unknown function (DUF4397)